MTLQVLELVCFGGALISLAMSGASFGKDRHAAALAFLFIAALLLRLSPMFDPMLHSWDERHHALVARHLIDQPLTPTLYLDPAIEFDHRDWNHNHIWLHKPPLALWGMALSMAAGGVNVFAARLPSLLYSLATMLVIYQLGRDLFDRRAGCYAAALFALNGFIIQVAAGQTPTDHVDACFLFFTTASVACVFRHHRTRRWRWLILAGLAIGAAVLTKWMVGLLAIPILLTLEASRQRVLSTLARTALVLALAALVATPWQLHIIRAFPMERAFEYAYNTRHLTEALEGHEGGPLFHITRLFSLYSELAFLPLIWACGLFIRHRRMTRTAAALAIWFLLPFIFFTFAATKMKGYTLPAIPALFIGFGAYLATINKESSHHSLAAWLTVLVLLLPLRGYIQKLKPFESHAREAATIERIRSLPPVTRDDRTVLFGVEDYLNVMFHTDYTCYPTMPTQEVVDALVARGRTVSVMCEPGRRPELTQVTFLEW